MSPVGNQISVGACNSRKLRSVMPLAYLPLIVGADLCFRTLQGYGTFGFDDVGGRVLVPQLHSCRGDGNFWEHS